MRKGRTSHAALSVNAVRNVVTPPTTEELLAVSGENGASSSRWLLSIAARGATNLFTTDPGYERLQSGESFPSISELSALPPEMRRTLKKCALSVLRQRLSPIIAVLMRRRAKRKILKTMEDHMDPRLQARPSLTLLQQLPCFARWENLEAVVEAFQPQVFTKNEIVVHQGELDASGLFVLTHGTARQFDTEADLRNNATQQVQLPLNASANVISSPMARSRRRASLQFSQVLPPTEHAYGPGMVLGDCNLASQQPQKRSIRVTSSEAIVFNLSRKQYRELLKTESAATQAHIMEHTIQIRTSTMKQAYPLTVTSLLESHYFKGLPEEIVATALEKMICRVYKSDSVLYRVGEPASSLFVLVRGRLLFKGLQGKPDTVVSAPTIVGDLSWVQLMKRSSTCIAVSACDVYMLTKDSMKSVLAAVDLEALLPHQQAADNEAHNGGPVASNFVKFLPFVRAIPLVAPLVPRDDDPSDPRFGLLQDLAEGFKSTVFKEKTTIASATQECDRLIVILSGNAVAQVENRSGIASQVILAANEPVGFTLLVTHRWAHRVVAVDTVEAITMHEEKFRKILKKHRVLAEVQRHSEALVFPEAVSPELKAEALALVSGLKNPPLYPRFPDFSISQGSRVPTEAKLKKLNPIRMKNQLTTCLFSRHSMTRITGGKDVTGTAESPRGSRLKPMILGKHTRITMGYKQKPKKDA